MLKTWVEMPQYFVTSANTAMGQEEILDYIEEINKNLKLR
jgi:GTP-binding protein